VVLSALDLHHVNLQLSLAYSATVMSRTRGMRQRQGLFRSESIRVRSATGALSKSGPFLIWQETLLIWQGCFWKVRLPSALCTLTYERRPRRADARVWYEASGNGPRLVREESEPYGNGELYGEKLYEEREVH
jgi:hypothetical protein